jgi:hypothetical protein
MIDIARMLFDARRSGEHANAATAEKIGKPAQPEKTDKEEACAHERAFKSAERRMMHRPAW